MAINSKEKGKVGENELAHILRDFGYTNARRSQQYSGINNDADVVGVHGLHIECKRNEHLNVYNAVEQSIDDSKAEETPIVCHRKNRKPWLVTLLLPDFFEIYQELDRVKAENLRLKEEIHEITGEANG